MPQPITALNLFPTFATREDYKRATGQEAPAWDPNRQPKAWADPAATKAFTVGGVAYALYPNVYGGFDQVSGVPKWEQLGLPVSDALTVNIPPKGDGQTNVPGADQPEVPCPLRTLADDEVIRLGFAAIPQVWRADETPAQSGGDFTAEEKALLLDAARKVLGS